MSGLEVIGALAAASQVAQQGLKITTAIYDLSKKVRDAPESIRKQTIQVEQLIDIAKLIESNPSLQTDLVASVLSGCTEEAYKLLHILQKLTHSLGADRTTSVWKAMSGVAKEKKILEHLAKLEKAKTTLALCIETVDR